MVAEAEVWLDESLRATEAGSDSTPADETINPGADAAVPLEPFGMQEL